MSYYGGGGYPGQGPPGGYPGGQPGYPAPGGMPQPGGFQPGVGMPTPESAGAGYGGMPYSAAPPAGAPGNIGFGGMPQPGGGYTGMPGAPSSYQSAGYPQNPAYNTPAPSQGYAQPPGGYPGAQPGYPGAPAPGYPQGGAPTSQGYGQPATGYGGQAQPGYPGQPGAPASAPGGYGQPGQTAPGGAPAGYGQPGQTAPAGYGQPGQTAPGGAPGGYGQPGQTAPGGAPGGYGQGQPGQSAPGGMAYAGNVSQGSNVSALGQGGPHTGYKVREDGTLRPAANFNAENDAKILRKAMKGFGTDEKAIIDVLSYRSSEQRQQIKNMYKTMFGKDLIHDLKSELGGHFEDVILALMMRADEYDAYELKRAMRGIGTDEDAMIEILCSRSNAHIRQVNETYKTMYRSVLEKDIISDTSGHFKRLMVSLCSANRMENQTVDMNKATQDAQALYQAGEKRWGTDESQFNAIMASQSYEQLRAVFDAYHRISGKDIESVLRSEMSGNLAIGMLAIVKCVKSKPAYFAEKLYKSMKGAGTDDKTLIRVIATRAEVDMVQIKQEFQKMYHQSLEQFIRDDTGGDYRKLMLAMVGGGY